MLGWLKRLNFKTAKLKALLYERYHGSAVALAYRQLGNWDEAEELVQDVFIHAFDRLEQLRVPEAFGGWLRQIVRRMAINRMTRHRICNGDRERDARCDLHQH